MAPNVFAVPVFIVVFRETLETAIIVSVLLAFLKQTLDGPDRDATVYHTLRRQVWLGTCLGFLLCMIIAAAIIGVFYTVGRDTWQAHENYYEGAFCIIASLIITVMGAGLLRIGRLQEKCAREACESSGSTYYGKVGTKSAETLYGEAIVFVAGVSFSPPAAAIPLPVVIGLITGAVAGYIIYKGGSATGMQIFLALSTCFLYLVSAGLFSRAVWFFETQKWNNIIGGDAADLGNGPGSYDIDKSVWHVNVQCCSPELNGGGGWSILNAVFGWNNSATYGSVISYNLYWISVVAGIWVLGFQEKNGHLPFFNASPAAGIDSTLDSSGAQASVEDGIVREELVVTTEK